MSKINRVKFDQIIREDWGLIRTETKSEPTANYTLVTSKYTSFAWDLWIAEYCFPKESLVRYQLLPRNIPPDAFYIPVDGSNLSGVLAELVRIFVYDSA